MAEQEVTLDDVKTSVDDLLKQATDATASTLTQFAELQEKRAARLAKAEKRLRAHLGENHPRVVALARAESKADKLKQFLHTTAVRKARRPKVGPDEWLVFGRVLDAKGKPISNLRLQVFDKDRWSRDDLLGTTETDEYGDFAVVYKESDFDGWGEELPDLYVRIEDAEGNLLYSSSDNVQFNAGRAEYFEITLVNQPTDN
jgi:hypothetical protein